MAPEPEVALLAAELAAELALFEAELAAELLLLATELPLLDAELAAELADEEASEAEEEAAEEAEEAEEEADEEAELPPVMLFRTEPGELLVDGRGLGVRGTESLTWGTGGARDDGAFVRG